MKKIWITILVCFYTPLALGLSFPLFPNESVVGQVQKVQVLRDETFAIIGKHFDVGVYEMIEANPNVNPWEPRAGVQVIIPTRFVLPPGPRHGMVINLAEMRLYYYPPGQNRVITHPIGIGRKGWQTPLGIAKIVQKTKHPTWRPPESIRDNHALHGDFLAKEIPPGPDNPLGDYAMRLSIPGYLIHGTNRPGGIGVRSSSGCIRMFPADIESLFHQIPVGTQVRIIHEPFKIGTQSGQTFLEAHEPLSDAYYNQTDLETKLFRALEAAHIDKMNWQIAEDVLQQASGLPIRIN